MRSVFKLQKEYSGANRKCDSLVDILDKPGIDEKWLRLHNRCAELISEMYTVKYAIR